MNRAAVLGAGSMLGGAIVCRLRELGVPTLRIGRGAGMDVRMDLNDHFSPGACEGLGADVLFHCAAAFGGNDEAGLRENMQVNVASSAEVLALMARLGCHHLVYAGSVLSVEGADSAGLSAYGLSKSLAEQVLSWGVSRMDGRFCSLRLAPMYDTTGRCCAQQPWFGRIVGHAVRGLDLRMPSGGSGRNFVHVDDAARLMVKAAVEGLTGAWAVCSSESVTPQALAALAFETFGRGGAVIVDPAKKPFRAFAFPKDSPVFARLEESPCRPLRQGLAQIERKGTGEAFGPVGDT